MGVANDNNNGVNFDNNLNNNGASVGIGQHIGTNIFSFSSQNRYFY
ncbi:hypothetical protein GOV07_01830 [Candidatus Woesearchaeota archaeon]|nr:hypothetical protein [Candidatus Woesearchaeota archaeon]